ncbi:toxic anion resistance protein [Heliobacillus mobilis]|uniref:Toxic anion resistance protein n=1 Tax=Heliobacterium mobile TaxID=28064 RepID=A0A6I3SKD7_HELMO|nr:toxic anion resistance protein [Heliobacterium mobile]MTV49246.1 toxic anion resistance protein [Heliobacterium mobile]
MKSSSSDPFSIPGPFESPDPLASSPSTTIPSVPTPTRSFPPETLLSSLPPEQQRKAQALAQQLHPDDSRTLLQFGMPVQTELSRFADTILDHVRAKDSGPVGEILGNLMFKLKEVDPDELNESKGGFFNKLFGSAKRSTEKLLARYQTLGHEIDQISQQLDKTRLQLLRDVTLLETLFIKNREYFEELNVYIAAGRFKLEELRTRTIPMLQQKAALRDDAAVVQELNDYIQFSDRLEKKIHDLLISRTVTLQTAPQIRLIQNNDHVLVEKIQSSILTTIPLWKNQVVLTLTLHRQQSALAMQKQVTDTTNDLLLRNSEMLKTNSIGVARENERAIVDLETLKKTQENLIHTLEETLKIQQEGRTKRQEAETELARMEQELKNRLMTIVTSTTHR